MNQSNSKSNPFQLQDDKFTSTTHSLSISMGNIRERYGPESADVHFVKTSPEDGSHVTNLVIPAHRAVLSVFSEFFQTMFEGDWRERAMKEIPIREDIEASLFEKLILYLYGQPVKVTEEEAVLLFQAADYYDLSIIKGAISNTVSEWSNPDQVISLCISVALLEPLKLGDNPAIKACISYITKRFLDISLSPLPFEIMKMIVKSEDIVDPEIDIFKALLEWKENHPESDSEQLSELFSQIRYGVIPFEDLISKVGPTGSYDNKSFGEALKWHYKGTLRDFQLLDPKLVTLRAGSRQSIQYYGKVETWPRIFCQESETSHFRLSFSSRSSFPPLDFELQSLKSGRTINDLLKHTEEGARGEWSRKKSIIDVGCQFIGCDGSFSARMLKLTWMYVTSEGTQLSLSERLQIKGNFPVVLTIKPNQKIEFGIQYLP